MLQMKEFGLERVVKTKSTLSSQQQGCTSPHLCPGPCSWRSPLLQRLAQLHPFVRQSIFYKPIRNSPISATISISDAKIYILMNSCIKTPWVAELVYIQSPCMCPLDLAAPAPQNLWDAPSGTAELESRAGTFGVRSCFALQCKGVCATLESTLLAGVSPCLHYQAKVAQTAQGSTLSLLAQMVQQECDGGCISWQVSALLALGVPTWAVHDRS